MPTHVTMDDLNDASPAAPVERANVKFQKVVLPPAEPEVLTPSAVSANARRMFLRADLSASSL